MQRLWLRFIDKIGFLFLQNWKAIVLLVLILAVSAYLAISYLTVPSAKPTIPRVTLTEFVQGARAGDVTRVLLSPSKMTATRRDGTVAIVPGALPTELLLELIAKGINVDVDNAPVPISAFQSTMSLLVILPGFFIIWYLLTQTRRLSVGGRARLVDPSSAMTRFSDVAGQNEAKKDLGEIVDFLRFPKKYAKLGARIPKGTLLIGPPGVGKTLIARAVAGEAGVTFFSASGSDFRESYMGQGARKVRLLFKQAVKRSPAIIFIDEIESVGRRRSGTEPGGQGNSSEEDSTLNALLVEMDGFIPTSGVILIAATNRPEMIDEALLRPGRFDRHIALHYPDLAGRRELISVLCRRHPISPDVDLTNLAKTTTGLSGAAFSKLFNEAAINAARRNSDVIHDADLRHARLDILLGRRRDGLEVSEDEQAVVAIHEAGHALVSCLVEGARRPEQATIIPHGRALGAVLTEPGNDTHLISRKRLMADLAVALAGRAAEFIHLGTEGTTTGAGADFVQASAIARKMANEWGMATATPHLLLSHDAGKNTRERIDQDAGKLLDEAWEIAVGILTTHRNRHEAIIKALIEHETVSGETLMELARAK